MDISPNRVTGSRLFRRRNSKELTPPDLSGASAGPGLSELRIVLLGKPGAGKSAAGNTILGREEFETQLTCSAPSECQTASRDLAGRRVSVLDTNALCDISVPYNCVLKEVRQCISMSAPGPHAFLLVTRLGRYTQEEREAVKRIQRVFGEGALKHTMVLFTHGDDLRKGTIEEFLRHSRGYRELVSCCEGGCHVFNNENGSDRAQVTELLQKIDRMVEMNGGLYFNTETFQEAEREKPEKSKRERAAGANERRRETTRQ